MVHILIRMLFDDQKIRRMKVCQLINTIKCSQCHSSLKKLFVKTDQPNDGHQRSFGSYTSNNAYVYIWMCDCTYLSINLNKKEMNSSNMLSSAEMHFHHSPYTWNWKDKWIDWCVKHFKYYFLCALILY